MKVSCGLLPSSNNSVESDLPKAVLVGSLRRYGSPSRQALGIAWTQPLCNTIR